jgi:hypothetical protein
MLRKVAVGETAAELWPTMGARNPLLAQTLPLALMPGQREKEERRKRVKVMK